eukprot:scaffold2436_cov99-Cylindrotheca_fusiformis.AAC.1
MDDLAPEADKQIINLVRIVDVPCDFAGHLEMDLLALVVDYPSTKMVEALIWVQRRISSSFSLGCSSVLASMSTIVLASSFSETAIRRAEVLENDNTEESETTAASRAQTSDFKTLHGATEMAPNSLIQPTLKDVVLGRWFQDFPGNIAFRTYLADRSDEYDKADRAGKIILTKSIIQSLNASGTRFLGLSSPTTGIPMWEEASFKEGYNKISQWYRSARKTKNA